MSSVSLVQRKAPLRLVPTVRPASKPKPKTENENTPKYVKPIVTTMGRMFPSVDKLCDATFMKKITGLTTKKSALLFIAENAMVYAFFTQMEQKMKENNVIVRKDIELYMTTTKDVLVAISSFKIQLKQLEAEQKIAKKEQERQAIIEQERERILQEGKNLILAEHYQEQAEIARKEGNMKLADKYTADAMKLMEKQKEIDTTNSSDSSHESDRDEEEENEDEESSSSSKKSSSSSQASRMSKSNREVNAEPAAPNSVGSSSSNSNQPKEDEQLDIKRVIEIINATNEAGYLVVKHGTKEFKITDLVLDRVNAKLVLNIEPTTPEKPVIKLNF